MKKQQQQQKQHSVMEMPNSNPVRVEPDTFPSEPTVSFPISFRSMSSHRGPIPSSLLSSTLCTNFDVTVGAAFVSTSAPLRKTERCSVVLVCLY